MAGLRFRTALIGIAGALVSAAPAMAQFGTIFGDSPRPPANVPGRPAYPSPAPPPPADNRSAVPAPNAIQSQPLPPPPGTEPTEQRAVQRPGQPQPGPTSNESQPRGTLQQANTAPQPGDQVITAMPVEKIPNATAVFSGLDKITGRTITFDVAINETVQFGALQVTPRVCYTRPPTETPNTDGFVEVDEITLQGETKRIFTGWMFASSPGLHAVEHPIYDVWLVDCKKPASSVAGNTASNASTVAPSPPAAPPGAPAPARTPAPPQATTAPAPPRR